MQETITIRGTVALNEMVLDYGQLRRYVRLRNAFVIEQHDAGELCRAAFFQPEEDIAMVGVAPGQQIVPGIALRFADAQPGSEVEVEIKVPLNEPDLEQRWGERQFKVVDLRPVPRVQWRPPAPTGRVR